MQGVGISGISGSPVLVRPTFRVSGIRDEFGQQVEVTTTRSDILLFGVMQGSWILPPDELLRREVGAKLGDKVPAGMSLVTPIARLAELLDQEEVACHRRGVPSIQIVPPAAL